MKKTLTAIALVLGLGIAAGAAQAQTPAPVITNSSTAWQLDTWCQQDAMGCSTYLAGLWGGYAVAAKLAQDLQLARTYTLADGKPATVRVPTICAPVAVPGEQLRQVFLGYALAHPDRLTYAAGDEAIVALVTAFPCDRS